MDSYTFRKALLNKVTTTTTPLRPWLRPIAIGERVQFRILVIATRPDSGSRKSWDVRGIADRPTGAITYPRGVVGLTNPIVLPPRDAPLVAGCSVAIVDNGTAFGLDLTGIDGVPIEWHTTFIDVKDPEV